MLSYQEIFNIQRTTLPLSKKELENVLTKSVFTGYVQCSYSVLVQTLKELATAESCKCTINPDVMYQNTNNPFLKADCIIQVEGTRYYEEFINRVISNEDSKEWTDFVTYSETFKDELRVLKCQIIAKYLWNHMNLNNWYEEKNVSLLGDTKAMMESDWETFKNKVLLTPDLYGFIDSCNQADLQKATKALSQNLCAKLVKYKPELMKHITNNSKREEVITVKNPIIKHIFIVSNYAKQCEKDWPVIKFTTLDRRSFENLSMWEE
jgi:DNA-binding ferritin-like protein (Dps family)